MTINKKCFTTSLKHDYPESLKWLVVTIIIAAIGYIVVTYGEYILRIILSMNISSSTVIGIVVLCAVVLAYIFGIMGMRKEMAKSQTFKENMLEIEAIILGTYFIGYFVYLLCTGTFLATSMNGAEIACLYECCVGAVVFTIVNILITPIALAYARCKDEPEEVTGNGEAHTMMG